MPTLTTRRGERIKQDAIFVPSDPSKYNKTIPPPIPDGSIADFACGQCCFKMDVFAHLSDSDVLKNDKNSFYFYADSGITDIFIRIQKSNCGDWFQELPLNNNTYGRFFEYGKHPDFSGADFQDDYGKKYTGFQIDWRQILLNAHGDNLGVGIYRITATYSDIFGNTYEVIDDREFCLKKYLPNLVNGTVRVETLTQGLRGSMDDPQNLIDYSTGWSDQIRLPGIFFYKNSSYTKEYNQYGDADFNALKPIINEQVPKYQLTIKPVPGFIDWYLSTNVLQADQILITDYNSSNRHTFIQTPVIVEGDINPKDETFMNPLAIVEMTFIYGQNNLRKRN